MGRENVNMPWVRPCHFQNSTWTPNNIEAMRAAFQRICDVLQLDCSREDPMTELVVVKIVEIAQAGERDPECLCLDVLAELGTPSESEGNEGATSRGPPWPTTSAGLEEEPS
jgi:hypothetical protein